MAKPSGIKLCPLDEGEAVDIPSAKTTIGRGSFLQVADKRVSRNHATLEVSDDGKLIVVPIHTNPCFFKARGNGQQVILPKDKPRILEHGDVLSLLPDKLFFQVVYSNQKSMDKEGDENEQDHLKSTDSLDNSQEEKPNTIFGDGKEMALPVKKKRILPSWMKGAARRTGLGQAGIGTTHSAKEEANRTPVKTPNRARPVQPISKTKSSRKIRKSESDEDDWDEEKSPVKKSSRKRTSKRGRYRDDDDDDDDDDDEVVSRRRPRAASLKKPKYTDDDFVISDEELDLEHMSSEAESVGQGGRRGKDEDSDFVLDEEDSASDWESSSRKPRSKVKGGRTVSHKGRGSVRGKRKRDHDSDSFSDEDSDGYVPRPSKRRAAVAATSRMKASKVSDDDEDDDDNSDKSEDDNRKPAHKKSKLASNEVRKKKPGRRLVDDDEDDNNSANRKKVRITKQKVESNDEEDMEADETNSKRTGKKPCQYGKACYRKNAKHFEEFSHPQNNVEEDSSGSEKKGSKVVVRQKRAAALKQQEKLAALHANSDDDEDEDNNRDSKENLQQQQQQHSAPDEDSLNGDDNISADSDSDFDPDDEESPSRSKAAKRAPQNKPKQKASI